MEPISKSEFKSHALEVLWEIVHKDPADRMIVATARKMAAPLVTADKKFWITSALERFGEFGSGRWTGDKWPGLKRCSLVANKKGPALRDLDMCPKACFRRSFFFGRCRPSQSGQSRKAMRPREEALRCHIQSSGYMYRPR
jgi:hypothetical protein